MGLDKNHPNYYLKELIIVLCIILFAGFIRLPSLTQPLGPDQGIMSVIGEGILQGKLPYRDFWEMGSPAIFFTYALMFKIFGVSMAAIPITDILISMLTTFLIFLLASTIWDRKVGYLSALFFAFFSNGVRLGMHAGGDIAFGTFWYIAQRETFMLPLITAGFYSMLRSEKSEGKSWLLLSGFLAGLSFVYKFPAFVIFFCFFCYLNMTLLIQKQKFIKPFVSKNIALISGFILALLPFALFFFYKGAMREMTDVIFKFVFSVYGQLKHDYLGIIKLGLERTFFIAQENFILWIFFIASSIYIVFNERTKENLLMVGWGLASFVFLISHKEFFGYHDLIIFPPLSLLAGYGIIKALGPHLSVQKIFTEDFGKAFILLSLLANLIFFTTLNFMHYTKFYYYVTQKITRDQYYNFFNAYPKHEYSFPADFQVAQYISNHSNDNDMIYTLGGIESVIHFLTKRQSPSRFIFSWIIFSHSHGRGEQAEAYRKELLHDLTTKTPKFITVIESLEKFAPFLDIYRFIKNNYVLEKTFADDRHLYVYNQKI